MLESDIVYGWNVLVIREYVGRYGGGVLEVEEGWDWVGGFEVDVKITWCE